MATERALSVPAPSRRAHPLPRSAIEKPDRCAAARRDRAAALHLSANRAPDYAPYCVVNTEMPPFGKPGWPTWYGT